jgi:hypothetical protein
LQIHVDGLEIFKNTEFVVFSISSALNHSGNLFDTKFQIMKIPHYMMASPDIRRGVMHTAAAYFSWNFSILLSGDAPTEGFYGEALSPTPNGVSRVMGDYTGAFAFMKADGKARVECHDLKFHYSTIFCCDACFATQPYKSVLRKPALHDLLYTDFSDAASWRSWYVDHDTYMANSETISPWSCIPGWRKELCVWDFMHIGPLGFLRDFTASLCLDFLKRGELVAKFGPGSPDVLLQHLWCEFRTWSAQRKLGVPKGSLSLQIIGGTQNNKYPELASSIKASVVKHFTTFLAHFALEIAGGDAYTRLRATCGWGIAEFIHVSDSSGLVLSDHQVNRLVFGGRTYLQAYSNLAQGAAMAGQFIWKVRPKCHYFVHLLDFAAASKLNPAHMGSWHEESYLGKIKVLGLRCSGKTMLTTSLLRYFLYLGIRWERRRQTQLWSMPT